MFFEHKIARKLNRMYVFFSTSPCFFSSQRGVLYRSLFDFVFLVGGYLLAYNLEEAVMPGMIIVQE